MASRLAGRSIGLVTGLRRGAGFGGGLRGSGDGHRGAEERHGAADRPLVSDVGMSVFLATGTCVSEGSQFTGYANLGRRFRPMMANAEVVPIRRGDLGEPIRQPTQGWVYFIGIRAQPTYVKIGWTSVSAEARADDLQTGIPYELEVLGVLPGSQRDERQLHRRFEVARVRGEWFTPTTEIYEFIRTNTRKNRGEWFHRPRRGVRVSP